MNFFKKYSHKFLWGFIFIYIILFSFLSLKKYYGFEYNIFDLAIFNQVFFNTVNGRWFELTINLNNYLGDHFTPIIFFLLPIYKIWPNPQTLLVMQSAIIGLSAWPIYKITHYKTSDILVSLGVAFLWLANPFVHSVNLFEFHLISFAAFLIFWTFYFYQINNFKLFLLFFILSLLVREDIALILLAFFIFSFLDKKTLKWKLTSLILPLVYFVLAISFIRFFSFSGSYKFLAFYGWLGGTDFISIMMSWAVNIKALIIHTFNPVQTLYILYIFLPLLFIPLLRIRYLLLLLAPLAANVLSISGFLTWQAYAHYTMFLLPAIFISFIFALVDLKNFKKILLMVILFTFYMALFISPLKNTLLKNPDHEKIILRKNFLNKINNEESLVVSENFMPNLSNREVVYPIKYHYLRKTQFCIKNFDPPMVSQVLIDYQDFMLQESFFKDSPFCSKYLFQETPSNFRRYLDNYNLSEIHDNVLLWRAAQEESNKVIYKIEHKKDELVGVNSFLVDRNLEVEGEEKILSLLFHKKPANNDYLIRFYKDNSYYDLIFDYGLFNDNEWTDDKNIRFFYYLSDDVKAYQIFQFSYKNFINYNNIATRLYHL